MKSCLGTATKMEHMQALFLNIYFMAMCAYGYQKAGREMFLRTITGSSSNVHEPQSSHIIFYLYSEILHINEKEPTAASHNDRDVSHSAMLSQGTGTKKHVLCEFILKKIK